MRTLLLRLAQIALTLFPGAVMAQTVHVKGSGTRGEVSRILLREGTVHVPGQGLEVPGADLDDTGTPRHSLVDTPGAADRALPDSTWAALEPSLDSIAQQGTSHWIRYHLLPDPDLRDAGVILNVACGRPFEVYLNGLPLLRSSAIPSTDRRTGPQASDPLLGAAIPLRLACDGATEVIAVRVLCDPGEPLRKAGLKLSLHLPDVHYAQQRRTMHFGVFLGINLIILLLAVVIWALERRESNWLLLALLSLVTALDTFCDIGERMGALGFADGTLRALRLLQAMLVPWPMYLLIIVLGRLRGDLHPRRMKAYTIAVFIVTAICTSFGIGELMGVLDTSHGFQIADGTTLLIVTVIILAVILAVVVAWFAVAVIRLAVRLLRSNGYARWIGGGALVSSLLALMLKTAGAVLSTGFGAWLSIIGDYCSYVAVPVSIAVYLAIRSAHHNKLVARQRDELDAEVKERTAQLSAEKERSDELLLNILPAEVADELKRTGAAEARHFDRATVMFTDFKGFTTLTEQVGPADLLQELNSCFKAFDDIIGRRGIEKIKTIGDAYMCAGGLPDPTTSSPADVVHAALEMQAFMEARKAERDAQGKPAFEMRVGIHTGPVVAGIVGVKKFQYDIWGDTVNTASRMESSGEVGRVNISGSTYALVKNEAGLAFTPRGKVQAKGKGEMEMYFVSGA